MIFLSPGRLWALVAVVAVLAAYVAVQRQRKRYAVRFTNLELLASVAPHRPGWRRHLPAAAWLLALALLVVGFARPSRSVRVPREEATVMLAIDVSVSMDADDVSPSRLAAAQTAATRFVRRLPDKFLLGLVSFAGNAQVLVSPTTDHELVVRHIERLQLAPRTAIGEAIFASLDSIKTVPAEPGAKPPPARIVLMSDGANTSGRPNAVAAVAAQEASVPVSTIAFGTDLGTVEVQGELIPVPVDRDALAQIAEMTNGGFFEAESGDELRRVYDDIGSSIGYVTQRREITGWFVGAALVMALLAAAGSLVWTSRLP